MIKKLRIRFIAIIMALLTALLCIVFGCMYFFMYSTGEARSIDTMRKLAKNHVNIEEQKPRLFESDTPPADGAPEPADGTAPGGQFAVVISLDESKGITDIRAAFNPDEEKITALAELALAENEDIGIIKVDNSSMRYLLEQAGDGYTLVLQDMDYEMLVLSSLMSTFITVGAISLGALFLISVFLANRATKPVETAWEKQRQFVADASHELKTPLTVIAANTDVVLGASGETVASQEKWLKNIKDETKIMNGLVGSLLYLAKSDAQKEKRICEPFDLSACADRACLSFEAAAFEGKKQIEQRIEKGIFINGDESVFFRLLSILMDNAVRYSEEGTTIKASLEHKKDRIIFTVKNKGALIKKDNIPRLFERFYREDESRAKETGGCGLGLSIAKAICDAYKCRITAASSEAEGNVFSVTIPKAMAVKQ